MTNRQAIWVYIDGGWLDQKLCNIIRQALLESAEFTEEIRTQDHLARAHGFGRKRLIRTAQALGITDELKKILKTKRATRKTCMICGMQESNTENVQ